MTIAVGIIAAAVYFFLIPSMTSISSISALAIIMSHYIPLHVSTITMILNVVLLIELADYQQIDNLRVHLAL